MRLSYLLLAAVGSVLSTSAFAIPMSVVHQGRLMDSATGNPLDGQHTLNVAFYDAASGGTAVWTDDITIDADNGFFTASIGLGAPLVASTFDEPTYLQIAVDGGPGLTRIPVRSVPYAYRALNAANVVGGTVDASEVMVNGTTVIDGDGNYLGAITDTLSGLSCTHRELARWSNASGAWECSPETLLSLSCTNGQVAAYDASNATWACANAVSDADVIAVVEGSTLNLAAGTTIGGTAVSTLTSSDVASIVNSTTLVLDSSTTIGGQAIATTGDITWGNLAGIPSGFADDVDNVLDDAAVDAYVQNGPIDLASGSSVQGDFDVTGNLSVSGNWSANGFQLGNDSSACTSSNEGTLRWGSGSLQACSENEDQSGGKTYAWISAQGRPIVWSGGCTSHHHSTSWGKYCLNGEDFDNAAGYLSVAASGDVTIDQSGYYRVHWWAIQHGCGAKRVEWIINGTQRAYIHNDATTGNYWTHHSLDQVWPFKQGDTFYVNALANSCDGYAWHSWNANGSHSRMQIEYVGPL